MKSVFWHVHTCEVCFLPAVCTDISWVWVTQYKVRGDQTSSTDFFFSYNTCMLSTYSAVCTTHPCIVFVVEISTKEVLTKLLPPATVLCDYLHLVASPFLLCIALWGSTVTHSKKTRCLNDCFMETKCWHTGLWIWNSPKETEFCIALKLALPQQKGISCFRNA